MFVLTCDGIYKDTAEWLNGLKPADIYSNLDHYGRLGVDALSMATPSGYRSCRLLRGVIEFLTIKEVQRLSGITMI